MDNGAGTRTTLRLQHRFHASPDRVFLAWTRPEALRLWWCPEGWRAVAVEVDLRVGGAYHIKMRRDGDANCVSVHGRFLDVRPTARLVYTWSWEGAFPNMPETRITIDFRAIPEGTEVALRQEYLAMPLCTTHLSGWLAAFGRLAEVMASPMRPSDAIQRAYGL